jgi:hypothetical protein
MRIRFRNTEVFFTLYPGSGMENFGSGIWDKHPDQQHCLVVALIFMVQFCGSGIGSAKSVFGSFFYPVSGIRDGKFRIRDLG